MKQRGSCYKVSGILTAYVNCQTDHGAAAVSI